MARKKKRKKKGQNAQPLFGIDPDVMKGVWSILLVSLAVLSVLSFFGAAGAFGETTVGLLRSAFGWGMYLMPLVLVGTAAAFLLSWGKHNDRSIVTAATIFFSSILGFFAVSGGSAVARGGYWGAAFSWPLRNFLGTVGSVVVLGSLLAVAVLIAFNISITKQVVAFLERRKLRSSALDVSGQPDANAQPPEFKVRTLGQQEGETPREGVHEDKERQEKKSEVANEFEGGVAMLPLTKFSLPPLKLLEGESGKPTSGDIVANANIIKRTLQNFGIDVEMGEVNVGPTVTQYTMKPAEGVKLSRIIGLNNDLALALAIHPLRIEAPIPGRSLVGIEIPNKAATWVRLKDLIDQDEFQKTDRRLMLTLGRDVAGSPVYTDLGKMPHLLIAGSTGSGKTIALNTLILSLLYKNPPQYLRFIMIDPKRVEFSVYNGIPHLLSPVIVENTKAVNALKWAVGEMERRFEVLSKARARDIDIYNGNKKTVEKDGPMPYIVIVIDELADLMASKGREVEALVVRIAQMARAVGIHLVLATQRPSVGVITGLIKANITARMAFQVASQVDSRTILDMGGAEKLLGNGDMLYIAPNSSKPKRVQGAYIRDVEVHKVVDFLREQGDKLDEGVDVENFEGNRGTRQVDFDNVSGRGSSEDELYEAAQEVVVRSQKASASLLQRRLRVGYARAARLLDLLEERNIIGPGEGSKARDVYMLAEDLKNGAGGGEHDSTVA